jgi:hypothetical protein
MNINSIDNGDISIPVPSAEQHSHLSNQQVGNTIQNQSDPEEVVKVMNNVKKIPINPTPLYIFFVLSYSS